MSKAGLPPIKWDLLRPGVETTKPGAKAGSQAPAFDSFFQSAVQRGAASQGLSRAGQAAFAAQWAQQVLAQTQRTLFTSFGLTGPGQETTYSQMISLLALSMRLKEFRQPLSKRYERFRPGTSFDDTVAEAAKRFHLPEKLVHAVIKAESNYNPNAVSPAGARGLMQLMPKTAEDLGVRNSFDPVQNVHGGARYLRWMLNRFDGDLRSALAAYNWGPHNVAKKGTSSLPSETRAYIKRIGRLIKDEAAW